METHLEGNMLHQDEWSMSNTPPEFPLLSVLLRNLLVHGMTSLLIVHVPPFIHSCVTLCNDRGLSCNGPVQIHIYYNPCIYS